MTNLILSLSIVFVFIAQSLVIANQCGSNDYVYGENEVIDQLLTCSMGRLYDLDLEPHGEYQKRTAKTFVEQGLSNKTSIIFARLNGLWTAKRASFVESGWKCNNETTTVSSIIELNGLSLEVVEKVDIPIHRSQHKLAIHKPCKTFDLPLWMCRQSKPVYRTTKTWVNRAYFNITLSQQVGSKKPAIERLSTIFTCPETYKQKITYSPSAIYLLSKYVFSSSETSQDHTTKAPIQKRSTNERSYTSNIPTYQRDKNLITHPVSYATTQDGKSPASPPYHDSVNLITSKATELLRSSLSECINIVDSDLSLMADYSSFNQYKFGKIDGHSTNVGDDGIEIIDLQKNVNNECSNKAWLKNRINLANQADILDSLNEQGNHAKRSQFPLRYPVDPNQLLNPYGYYHDNMDQMIEDS